MQHARCKGVTCADPIDDPGNVDCIRLVRRFAQIDPGGDPVMVCGHDLARGRCDHFEIGECGKGCLGGFAPPIFPVARKLLAQQQRDVAVIADQDRRATDQFAQHAVRIAVPAFP